MDFHSDIETEADLKALINTQTALLRDGVKYRVSVEPIENKRTNTQNNALHKWCELCAKALNDAGLSQYQFFEILKEHGLELDWDKESFKKEVFKRTQKAMKDQESTADAKTTDYQDIYNALCRFFGNHGVSLPPWPDRFTQMEEAA